MKILINKRYGGFDISKKAFILYKERAGWPNWTRTDPILIQIVEELGDEANGRVSKLKIIEIPDDIEYTIEEYDGIEWVAEKHRTWR